MRKNFFRYVLYQFAYSFFIVLVCAVIASFISYKVISDNLKEWIIESNKVVMSRYAHYINDTLLVGTSEIYLQIVNEVNTRPYFNYYSEDLKRTDLLYTLKVQTYLGSLQNSSLIIDEVSLYYPMSNLLVANDKIRYTLFFESRQKDIQPYIDLFYVEEGYEAMNGFRTHSDVQSIYMMRAIKSGERIRAVVFIRYSIPALRKTLSAMIPYEEGNIIVAGTDGQVLFDMSGDYPGGNISDDESIYRAMIGDGYCTANIGSTRSVVSYQKDAESGWQYITFVPLDALMNKADFVLNSLMISMLVTISLGLITAILLSIRQSRPMKAIVDLLSRTDEKNSNAYGAIQGALTNLMLKVEDRDAQLERIMPLLRDEFMLWLLTEMPDKQGDIDARISFSKVSFPFRYFYVIAVRTDANETDRTYAIANARLLLQQALTTERSLCGLYKKDDLLLGLVNTDHVVEQVTSDDITALPINKKGHRYYITIAKVNGELNTLSGIIPKTIESLKYSFLYPDRNFFSPELVLSLDEKSNFSYHDQIVGFLTSLRCYDEKAALAMLKRLIDDLQLFGCSLNLLERIMKELIEGIKDFSVHRPNFDRQLEKLVEETQDIRSFSQELSAIVSEEIHLLLQNRSHSSCELIEAAVKYIELHLLDNQLSLPGIASELGVSPNYLSRIFHEVTQLTFVEYVGNAKMECGRKLLLETDMNLRDIAHKLNYSSPQYFISRFKKRFQITPSAFRGQQRE